MMERRRALGGSIPKASSLPYARPLPDDAPSPSCARARAAKPSRRRWGSPGCCATWRGPELRQVRRADHPRRGPHVRHGLAVPPAEDLRRRVSCTNRSTTTSCSTTPSRRPARSSRKGSPRPGRRRASSPPARRTPRRHPDRAVLHVLFDVRLPTSATSSGRPPTRAPRVPARGDGWADDLARRGAAAPGRALLVLASTVPASGVRPGLRLRGGDDRPAGSATDVRRGRPRRPRPDVFYYLTLYNENYPMPAMPEHVQPSDVMRGLYRWSERPEGPARAVTLLFSGTAQAPPWRPPAGDELGRAPSCGRRRRTRRCARRR